MFRVVFVMDIFNRTVVLAKGGIREHYCPVSDSSKVCSRSDPLEIVDALRPLEIYIADLNVLQGKSSPEINADMEKAVSLHAETMLDLGVSAPEEAKRALELASTVIIGTETGNLETVQKVAFENPGRVSVSIDIKHGKVLKQDQRTPENPFEIVKLLNEFPLKDLIFLDLDRVGTASGFDPELLRELAVHSRHSVLLGGGVRDMEHLFTLKKIGIGGALIATAIHSGAVPPELLRSKFKEI